MTVTRITGTAAMAASLVLLAACQTPQGRQDELARICADPVNRAPGSFYWGECQSLYPSTEQQLQKNFLRNAPSNR